MWSTRLESGGRLPIIYPKPDRTNAKVMIAMPDAYVYGMTGDVDDERVSYTERVVTMKPVVTRMNCVRGIIWQTKLVSCFKHKMT